jgi:preprotein translocase subunit SecD
MVSIARRGSSYLRFSFWVALAAVGLYCVWPFKDRPRRGIDLVGGFYITLKVDIEDAIKSELMSRKQNLLNALQDFSIADPVTHKVENGKIVFGFRTADEANKALQAFKARNDLRMDIQGQGEQVMLSLPDAVAANIKERAVEGNVDVLRKRLDGSGIAEIGVSRQGDTNIIIELPNVDW